jgi:site-specific DNA recombinase
MYAAIYLRSSKDRHDVSLDAQRRELAALAKTRQLKLVAEFADAVESGKDEDREGFQSLLRAIRNPRRGWDTLLVLDTSRIARRRHIGILFELDCKKHGVRAIYKSLPDSDPVSEMLLKSVLQAIDEWHSLTSRAKGLAGMRENVRQGFRAGGRAPLGYRLDAIETGAVREGFAVRKSRLVPSADAPRIQTFLQARARGVKRALAGLELSATSQIGIEWNALTYAGHTVWNVHAENGSGRKRRSRSEWVIQRDTHAALITDDEAESIIARLEAWAPARTRRRESGYLLTGLLVTAAGKPFHGDRGSYSAKGHWVKAAEVDTAVTRHVLHDLQQPAFVRAVTKAARGIDKPDRNDALRDSLAAVEKRLARLVGLIEQTNSPGPLLRQMEALEVERGKYASALAIADAEAAERRAMSRITEHEVRRLLVERAAAIEDAEPEALRDALQGLLSKVELEGNDLRIHYRIHRDKMASPRATDLIPVVMAYPLRCA